MIDYALMEFINSRPDGNILRDIAIQALKDYRRREQAWVFPYENEARVVRVKSKPVALKPEDKERLDRVSINVYTRKNLKKLRNKAQMYQVDFANKFEADPKNYNRYETGKNPVPIELIVNVCRAFDVSIEKFMTTLI